MDVEATFVPPQWLYLFYLFPLILYALLCIWTVYEFCHNLLCTAKAQSHYTNKRGLDIKQLQIIDVSSKYLSLFMFAMLSTSIHYVIFSIFNFNELDPAILMGVDCVVNLLCLFLQFPFTSIYYYQYCRSLDICCRRVLTWRLGKHDQAIKAKRAVLHSPKVGAQRDLTVDEMKIAEDLDSYLPATSSTGVTSEMTDKSTINSIVSIVDHVALHETTCISLKKAAPVIAADIVMGPAGIGNANAAINAAINANEPVSSPSTTAINASVPPRNGIVITPQLTPFIESTFPRMGDMKLFTLPSASKLTVESTSSGTESNLKMDIEEKESSPSVSPHIEQRQDQLKSKMTVYTEVHSIETNGSSQPQPSSVDECKSSDSTAYAYVQSIETKESSDPQRLKVRVSQPTLSVPMISPMEQLTESPKSGQSSTSPNVLSVPSHGSHSEQQSGTLTWNSSKILEEINNESSSIQISLRSSQSEITTNRDSNYSATWLSTRL